MSNWIQIDNDLYAKQPENDPEEIVNMVELDQEITKLQAQIDSIRDLEYPEGVSDDMRQAINEWNEKKYSEREQLASRKEELEDKKLQIIN